MDTVVGALGRTIDADEPARDRRKSGNAIQGSRHCRVVILYIRRRHRATGFIPAIHSKTASTRKITAINGACRGLRLAVPRKCIIGVSTAMREPTACGRIDRLRRAVTRAAVSRHRNGLRCAVIDCARIAGGHRFPDVIDRLRCIPKHLISAGCGSSFCCTLRAGVGQCGIVVVRMRLMPFLQHIRFICRIH